MEVPAGVRASWTCSRVILSSSDSPVTRSSTPAHISGICRHASGERPLSEVPGRSSRMPTHFAKSSACEPASPLMMGEVMCERNATGASATKSATASASSRLCGIVNPANACIVPSEWPM
eukprot:scaffold224529_cov26-Tisochrysis_lutea.AAC.1